MDNNCDLNISKFTWLCCRYPMHRDGRGKTLWFVVEHQPERTRAGYEVEMGKKSAQFVDLRDAVKFYNERGRKKRGTNKK